MDENISRADDKGDLFERFREMIHYTISIYLHASFRYLYTQKWDWRESGVITQNFIYVYTEC